MYEAETYFNCATSNSTFQMKDNSIFSPKSVYVCVCKDGHNNNNHIHIIECLSRITNIVTYPFSYLIQLSIELLSFLSIEYIPKLLCCAIAILIILCINNNSCTQLHRFPKYTSIYLGIHIIIWSPEQSSQTFWRSDNGVSSPTFTDRHRHHHRL